MESKGLINFLKNQGLITDDQAQEVFDELGRTGKPLDEIVEDYGIISRANLMMYIASTLNHDYYPDISQAEFTPELLSCIEPKTARTLGVLPVATNEVSITVAMTDPLNQQIVDDLRFATNKEIMVIICPVDQIQSLINEHYGIDPNDANYGDFGDDVSIIEAVEDVEDLESQASSAPIVKFVNTILVKAIHARASDIHFEPFEKEFKIRYRVDGALYEMSPPPRKLSSPIASRIKVMAGLNIAERRIPQDGRIQTMLGGRPVDLRVSTLPTQFGESVVLRVLDRSVVSLDLETLGMPEDIYKYICHAIEMPHGIFIVTGPTGSGKTTTLYSCLNRINTIDSKLLTVEDPVEYELEGIQQVPVNEAAGNTFGKVLRAFLRQDPDRIMVGETRDMETAQIAIQAALTGHLVLTSLHTNDSAGAITRLIDMGVEPFLISAALEGILAQRLVRKICKECKTPFEPSTAQLATLGLSAGDIGNRSFYYGTGCEHCNDTGYRGRNGIYELLDIREPIRLLINERAPTIVIRQKAIELGMTTLRQNGVKAILDGDTTSEEILKYT